MNPGPQGLYEDQYVFSINVNKRENNNNRNINLRTLLWDELLIIIMYIINLITVGLKKAQDIAEALRHWINGNGLQEIHELIAEEDEDAPGLVDSDLDDEWENGTDEQTIKIVDKRPTLGVIINSRFKDEILVDSGSCTNVISQAKLEMIEKLTGNQIPRLKEEAPPLFDMNNNKVNGEGIVMLNLMFTGNNLVQKRVPFVVSKLEERLLIGSNTLNARKLNVGSNGQEFILQKFVDNRSKNYYVNELRKTRNQKTHYEKLKPIDLTLDEEIRLEKGETKAVRCQIGEKLKSNLCNVMFNVMDPFKPYVGYGHTRKRGGIIVSLTNPKDATIIPKGTPIGHAYPIDKDDFEIQEVPSIASMSKNLSNCPFYHTKCICKSKFKLGQTMSFGINDQSTMFNHNFDYLVTDPDYINLNKTLKFDEKMTNWNKKSPITFVLRDFHLLSIKRIALLTTTIKNHPNIRIVCVTDPCESHAKIITNHLHVSVCSHATHEVEEVMTFDDYPFKIESNVRIKDNMKATFPSIKITIHVPLKSLEGVGAVKQLKEMIKNHFMFRTLKLNFQKQLADEKVTNNLLKENFRESPNNYGSKLKENCAKCPACVNKCDLLSPTLIPDTPTETEEGTDKPTSSYYHKFYHKSTAQEFNLIDEYESKLVRNYINSVQEEKEKQMDYSDDESYISITKMEDKCPSWDLGGFKKPSAVKNWRELIDLKDVPKEDQEWITELMDDYNDIMQLDKNQRGRLKLPFEFKIELKDENLQPFPITVYPQAPLHAVFMERAVNTLLDLNAIQEVDITRDKVYHSPIFMRPKNSKVEHMVKEAEKNGTSAELRENTNGHRL